jgi:hypothetical protein
MIRVKCHNCFQNNKPLFKRNRQTLPGPNTAEALVLLGKIKVISVDIIGLVLPMTYVSNKNGILRIGLVG